MTNDLIEYVIGSSITLSVTIIMNYVVWFRYDGYVRWAESVYSKFKCFPGKIYFGTRLKSTRWRWIIRFWVAGMLLLSIIFFMPVILLAFALLKTV